MHRNSVLTMVTRVMLIIVFLGLIAVLCSILALSCRTRVVPIKDLIDEKNKRYIDYMQELKVMPFYLKDLGYGRCMLSQRISNFIGFRKELPFKQYTMFNKLLSNTPLIEAAEKNDVAMIKILLEIGIDINEVDQLGDTALSKATLRGNTEAVDVLMAAGSDEYNSRWRTFMGNIV